MRTFKGFGLYGFWMYKTYVPAELGNRSISLPSLAIAVFFAWFHSCPWVFADLQEHRKIRTETKAKKRVLKRVLLFMKSNTKIGKKSRSHESISYTPTSTPTSEGRASPTSPRMNIYRSQLNSPLTSLEQRLPLAVGDE